MQFIPSGRFSLFFLLVPQVSLVAATITVGPTGMYATPCAAFGAAQDGDIIEIDAAGNYAGDVCGINPSNLTIRGVNGRPHIDAAGNNAYGKGTWVVDGNDIAIENIEMSGATVSSNNGAAIRAEGTNLTIRNCYFHNNQEGILAAANLSSSILIEYTEFSQNGYGDGYTHNLYMGNIQQFTLQFSYSHQAIVGHLVKSRAATNYILYNRLTDETGTASYELDLPNGGLSYVIGNEIQQSPSTQNPNLLAYLEEGTSSGNPSHLLYVVNNTFVNSHGSGNFVLMGSAASPALLENNFFTGGGTITNQTGAILTSNYTGNPSFVNAAAYDYHLNPGSAGIDAGILPGLGSGFSLVPTDQYLHPTCGQLRNLTGPIDIGAFEYNGDGPLIGCTLNPITPHLGSLGLSGTSTIGGTVMNNNTVTLTAPAPAAGLTVRLSSSDPHATVPASVVIPAGAASANFSIATSPVNVPTVAVISGTQGGETVSAQVTINPPGPAIASVVFASPTIRSGGTLDGNQVTLTSPAPNPGVTVFLASATPSIASVPASVTVPAGKTSATFPISAGTVSNPTSVSISAQAGGKTSEGFITVSPAPHRGIREDH